MKTTKKLVSLLLALIMVMSVAPAAFAAQDFSGQTTVSGDITINSGAVITSENVFTGNVTIASGAKVTCGTFKGTVTNNSGSVLSPGITGGVFEGAVINNGYISEGDSKPVFKGSVTNSKTIIGGDFKGAVTNKSGASVNGGTFSGPVTNESGATITTGLLINPEFKGKVTNAGTISAGTFDGEVTNTGKITTGIFNGKVTNSGSINGGTFTNYIANTGTVSTSVAAIIAQSAEGKTTYRVQKSPIITSKVTASGNNTSFVLPANQILTVAEGAELALNCDCTINGTVLVAEGGKISSTGGSLDGTSSGSIRVPMGASFSGTSASKFAYITYKQYSITVDSNIDANQFDITVAKSAYKGDKVSYVFDLSGSLKGCLTINSITVYSGKKSESNIILKSTDLSDSFTMPDSNAIIYVDCIANHTEKTERKDPDCTHDGYENVVCETCGHTLSTKTLPALGHSWSAWTVNTDPNAKLLKSRTCSRCHKTENAYVEIKGYDDTITVDYKSTLTFNCNCKAPDDCYIQWSKNNGSKSTSSSYTVSEATEDFTVTVVVLGSVNDTATVKVVVKHGFFDKIKAFFRGLFKKLPVYVDGVKQ